MLSLDWIAQVVGGRVHRPDPAREISGVSIDSRLLRAGEFFVALPGQRTDGHLFLEEAFRRGASGAIVSKIPSERFYNCIQVPDTTRALQQLAAARRKQLSIPIVGITGSSGKTTTKELLYALLSRRYRAYRSPGNYNTEIGLPLALLNMPPDAEVGIFELGLQRPGDLKILSELARPTIGVLTSVGDAHLGFFPSREALARAKWELIESLSTEGVAALNFDAPHLASWAERLPVRVIGFGIEDERASIRAKNIRDDSLEGLAFEISARGERFDVRMHLLGRMNVYNALAASSVAFELDVPVREIQRALSEFKAISHRMELKRSQRFGLILDDSYNANPASTKEALWALARLRVPHRKIFVLGDMLELGSFAKELHRELAGLIDELGLDRVFTVGELAKEAALALAKRPGWGASRALSARSLTELKALLWKELVDDRNLILIKGSRGMELDRLVSAL